jgi:hypothetical protein
MSITSFLSQITEKNHDKFPLEEIKIYYQKNSMTLEKIENLLISHLDKFKNYYENYK